MSLSEAIRCIPADDREIWVQVGMSVKSELGNDGFDLWDAWSRNSERYKKASALAVWRSIKPHGGITIRTLYRLARENGWQGDGAVTPIATPKRDARVEKDEAARHLKAAKKAAYIVSQAKTDKHAYLEHKGFKDEVGLIDLMVG